MRMYTVGSLRTPRTGAELWVQRAESKIGWRGRKQEQRHCGYQSRPVLCLKGDAEKAIGGCRQWDKMPASTR